MAIVKNIFLGLLIAPLSLIAQNATIPSDVPPAFPTLTQTQSAQELLDCNAIFEQRRGEILAEIQRVDEEQQALRALQSAAQNVLDQREAQLKQREANVSAQLKEIAAREEAIRSLLKKNDTILGEIRNATDSKITATYAGMKDSKSAAILEAMPDSQAALILFNLNEKAIAKIFAKMTPDKAATLTKLLAKGPPFDNNASAQ